MATEIGARVTAVLSANPKKIELLGHGVYVGTPIHPQHGFPNPCLKLDDGTYAWGCECWWGPEDKILPHYAKDFPDAEVVKIKSEGVAPTTVH